MLQFLLCDDNLSALTRLEKMFETLFSKHSFPGKVALATTDAKEALDYAMQNDIQVVVLDIDLKSSISGLDLAEHIRKTNKKIYFIFTTGHLEYSLVAYRFKTFDFLPKPLTIERLEETLLRLLEDISGKPQDFLQLPSQHTIINTSSINYIKRDGMKLLFYTDSRTYTVYSSFHKMEDLLPSNFIRCHKSYIVNLDKITDIQVQNNIIVIQDNIKCCIGPKYKNKLMEVLSLYGDFAKHFNCVNN